MTNEAAKDEAQAEAWNQKQIIEFEVFRRRKEDERKERQEKEQTKS